MPADMKKGFWPFCHKSGKGESALTRQNSGKTSLLVRFSVIYIFMATAIFLPYWCNGCSLICSGDATVQHYPALSYYGMYLRQGVKNLFFGNSSVFPTWDMSIGLGGDVVTTLHYYGVGDPLSLISIFFTPDKMELCYTLLICLRLYVSGITAIIYFRHHRAPSWSCVLGALVYSFSGYAISVGVFHPFFSIPMMYLPLLLLGVDLILEAKSPLCFILTVAIALLSNFYFFYMLVLVTAAYGVIRYISIFKKVQILSVVKYLCRFLCYAVTGMLLAMPVFLPNIIALLSSDRLAVSRYIPFLYPTEYYLSLPAAVVSDYEQFYVYMAVSSVALVSLFVLLVLLKKDKNIFVVISVILAGICLLFPIMGSAFNGFSYVTNRWIWALNFIFGYMTAKYLPEAVTLNRKQLTVFCLFVCLYGVLCIIPSDAFSIQTIVALMALLAVAVLVVITCLSKVNGIAFRRVVSFICVATLLYNGYYHATNTKANWLEKYQPAGITYERYWDSSVTAVSKLPEAETARFDSSSSTVDFNGALVNGAYGTSFYFSTVNSGTASFQHTQMLNTQMDQQYRGLNNRSYLLAALGVRYYIADDTNVRPYGFNEPVSDNIYTSNNVMPLVYTFDTVCTDSEKLSVTQKQQALLQCAMMEQDFGLPEATLNFSDEVLPYTVVDVKGNVKMEGNRLTVSQAGDSIKLEFQGIENSELYACFEGISFSPLDNAATQTDILLSDGEHQQHLCYKTPQDNYSSGRSDFLINMGYSDRERTAITLTFSVAGTYTFSKLQVAAQPMNGFSEQVNKLANSGVSEIAIDRGALSFESVKDTNRIACVAIPYQRGWSVTVDGKEAPVFEVQNGLCGVYLTAGRHTVVMTYQTPALALGWMLFLFGLVVLCFVISAPKLKCYIQNKTR